MSLNVFDVAFHDDRWSQAFVKKKVLYLLNHAGYFVSHRLPLALAAREAGYDVHVATPASRHVVLIKNAGLPWHPVQLTRGSLNVLEPIRAVASILSLYRRLQPDIVHQVTSKPVLFGTVAARVAKVPVVVNALAGLGHVFISDDPSHRGIRALLGAAYRTILKHPRSSLIFHNSDDRRLFVNSRFVRESETTLIRGSGVDTARFTPGPRGNSDPPAVVLVARMLRTKGINEFVEAARSLKAQGVPARFILVGDPDPDNPASLTESELQSWHREGIVEYLGRRDDVAEIIRGADIGCLPSYREGLPQSLLESASSGLPLVAFDVAGCREIVVHGENGFLVPPRNVEALAEALRTLILDDFLRERFGKRSRELVLDQFSQRRVIGETLDLYRTLLP